jgi:hypothetical protein
MAHQRRQKKTSESWFQDHLQKAINLDANLILQITKQSQTEAAQYLLLPVDGFRALIARCLGLQGVTVELSDEPPGPDTLIPKPKKF